MQFVAFKTKLAGFGARKEFSRNEVRKDGQTVLRLDAKDEIGVSLERSQ
jgi:hypothetical protein